MAAGPSGLHKNVPPGTFLTPLDEFLCCYPAGPECLISILEFLDFDDEGNNRNLHIPEEKTKCSPLYEQVWPVKGFCMKTFNGKGGLVFINICHSEDIACPSNDILDLMTVDLPVRFGKSHRERDEYGDVCLAFDVILNTDFYEKQVVRYELLKAYVLVIIMRRLNEQFHLELQMVLVSQVNEQTYWGEMPQYFIHRNKSACYVDQTLARMIFYAARARRMLRRAKKFAVKRLRKHPGRSSNRYVDRIRPIHPPRSRTTPCRECIRRSFVNPEEVIEEDSEDDDEGSEVEVEEGSKNGSEEGSEIECGSEKDGSEEESSDNDSGEESCEVEKDSDVQETSEEDDSSEWGEGLEKEEGSEREEDFEDEGSAEQGFEEETGSEGQGFEEEDSYEEDEGSDGEGFKYGCYEEAEGNSKDIEVDSQGKVHENFEEERSSVEEDSGEEGDVEEGSDEEKYSEDEEYFGESEASVEDSEEYEASVEDSEESEASEEDAEEEEIGNDEDPEKEEDSEERRNLIKEIERDLIEEVENVFMKGVDKVPIHKELKEEVEKEIREEVEKYLREEGKKYFEIEVLKNSYAETVQDPYKKEKEDYGMKVVDPSEAAVPPYNSITEPLSPTPGCEASVAMQDDFIRSPFKLKYLDLKNGIYRIGFLFTDERFSSPTVVSPGDWRESVPLVNSIFPKENSHNLKYELLESLIRGRLHLVAILDLPVGTKVEGMAVFATADGVLLCENGMRFCVIPLEYAFIATQIKVVVNGLKVGVAIPYTEESIRYRMAERRKFLPC